MRRGGHLRGRRPHCPDPDGLPPEWGHSADPYAQAPEADTEIPEPPPGDELPPMEEGESPDKPGDEAPAKEIPPSSKADPTPPEPKDGR